MEDGEKVNTCDCGDVAKRQRLSTTIPNISENIPSTSSTHRTISYNNISDEINQYDINEINYLNPLVDESQLFAWQEEQLRRSIFENRANRLFEFCFTNLNVDIDRDNIQNRAASNGLEESAILMAINEHGLQDAPSLDNHSISSSSSSIDSRLCLNLTTTHSVSAPILSSPLRLQPSLSHPQPIPSINEFVNKDNDNIQLEHIDFMEAAVSIAIQQNGLTACSIQMSPNR